MNAYLKVWSVHDILDNQTEALRKKEIFCHVTIYQ